MRYGSLLAFTLIAALAAAAGCGDDNGGDDDSANGDGGNTGNGGDGGGTNEFADAGLPPEACKKVDVIISVDDSSSMDEEKLALANDVFPAFATALLDIGGGLEDYRIGVTNACPAPANYHTQGDGGACNFASGEVWMDSGDPALTTEFGCVGNVYSGDAQCTGDNDDEQPASTAAASIEDPAGSGVNARFLRDDALLVVVAITDEDEQPTPDRSAQQVYDRLVAVKGDVKRMVFLGIGGGVPGGCDGAYGFAEEADKLHTIANLFIAQERGVWWDLCEGHLEDGLTEAMQVIEQACNEFPQIP